MTEYECQNIRGWRHWYTYLLYVTYVKYLSAKRAIGIYDDEWENRIISCEALKYQPCLCRVFRLLILTMKINLCEILNQIIHSFFPSTHWAIGERDEHEEEEQRSWEGWVWNVRRMLKGKNLNVYWNSRCGKLKTPTEMILENF